MAVGPAVLDVLTKACQLIFARPLLRSAPPRSSWSLIALRLALKRIGRKMKRTFA